MPVRAPRRWNIAAPALMCLAAPVAAMSAAPLGDAALVLLLVIFVPSGIALALATLLFRRKSQAQQQELRNMYAVAESMISAGEAPEIYRRIVQTLPGPLQASNCYLWLHNRVTSHLDVLAGTDKFPQASVPVDAVAGPVTCFKNKALLEVPDAEHCPFVDRSMVRQLGQKSLLFVPMVSEGEVFGVLEIDDRRRKRAFSEEQKACAQHVANLGALAMKVCEQRSMREQLYRTEKMAAVGELITGVAHELKTPLAAMTSMAELAMARHGSGPLTKEVGAIRDEAQHAATILQRLMSFARPQKSGPKLVDINAVLRSVVKMREEKWAARDIRVRVHLSPTPPIVHNDEKHLEQVFLNLMIAAERAIEEAREKVITVRSAILARRVLISISDSGPGHMQDMQNRLFDPVLDGRKPNVTAALGMAVCQSLIEGHGGSIRVNSAPGQSTTFEIEYPLAAEAPAEPESAPAAPLAGARPNGNLTALVIDSDRKVQDSLLNLLSDRHYRVITVSSAEVALDLIARAPFDLVFCDVRLRGISGIELYQRVKNRIQSFVFLTSDAFSADLREMFSEPNQAVLAKPFTAAEVERLLEQIEPRL